MQNDQQFNRYITYMYCDESVHLSVCTYYNYMPIGLQIPPQYIHKCEHMHAHNCMHVHTPHMHTDTCTHT